MPTILPRQEVRGDDRASNLAHDSRQMRIGFDCQSVRSNLTGLGVYTQSLFQALESEAGREFEIVPLMKKGDARRDLNTLQRLAWENLELPSLIRHEKLSLVHVPAFAPPLRTSAKLVVTVHDLIGMLFRNQRGWPSRFYWGTWLPGAVKRAGRIIADSENTKSDLVRKLRVPENQITVIYPSGHERFKPGLSREGILNLKRRFGIGGKYFLFVGTMELRKNLQRVIQAFRIFLSRAGGSERFQLVLAGSTAFAHGQVYRELRNNSGMDSDCLIFCNYLSPEDINALYCGAEALVFPSLYEGFGLPVLEAMGAGTAVITSNTSSLPEAAGDAALFVDPESVNEITEAMKQISQTPALRESLIKKGFEQIRKFSWKKTARQTLQVYQGMLDHG